MVDKRETAIANCIISNRVGVDLIRICVLLVGIGYPDFLFLLNRQINNGIKCSVRQGALIARIYIDEKDIMPLRNLLIT